MNDIEYRYGLQRKVGMITSFACNIIRHQAANLFYDYRNLEVITMPLDKTPKDLIDFNACRTQDELREFFKQRRARSMAAARKSADRMLHRNYKVKLKNK